MKGVSKHLAKHPCRESGPEGLLSVQDLLSGRSTAALTNKPDSRARCMGAVSDPQLLSGTCMPGWLVRRAFL